MTEIKEQELKESVQKVINTSIQEDNYAESIGLNNSSQVGIINTISKQEEVLTESDKTKWVESARLNNPEIIEKNVKNSFPTDSVEKLAGKAGK